MSVLVSTRSALALSVASDIVAPTPAPGFVSTDLVRGDVGRFWASSRDFQKATHTFDLHLPEWQKVGVIALFGVRALGELDPTITAVRCYVAPGWPYAGGPLVGSIALDARGDGLLRLPVPPEGASIRIEIVTNVVAFLHVGLIWVDEGMRQLPRAYATRQDAPEYSALTTEYEDRSVRAYEIADQVSRLTLGWGRLTRFEVGELVRIHAEVRGSLLPLVLIPDSSTPTRFFHGRLQPAMPYTVDFPEHTGLTWNFTESGRGLA